MRLPFLILTPVSVFLGVATAIGATGSVPIGDLLLVLVGAVSAHVSVNTFNEYLDFRSGLDATTSKTPFSGGSGALVDNPAAAGAVFRLAIASLIVTIVVGGYFLFSRGLQLLPLGVAGVLIIVTYTPWLNRQPFLCLVAPGLGFGPLMVVGTHVVLAGAYSMTAFVVSLVPFSLANNLLLLNQYPDLEADRNAGRRHFPIAYGVGASTAVYGVFALATCAVIYAAVRAQMLPAASYLALVPMTLAIAVFFGARQHAASARQLIPYLGLNVAATILTPVVLATTIIFG